MQRYDRLWERLLTLLGTLGEVDASTPGRPRLVIDTHQIELVMTGREWGDLAGIPYGSFLDAHPGAKVEWRAFPPDPDESS